MSDDVCLVDVFVCRRPGRKEVSNSFLQATAFFNKLGVTNEILENEPKSCLEVV